MVEAEQYDYLFKFIIIGDSGTGKTCLLHHFIEGKFKKNSTQTLGVEFGCKRVTIAGKRIKIQIWDTAGQERFRSVTRSYYRGAAAAIIVYDLTKLDSFSHISAWLSDARTLATPDIAVMVVGNKSDLRDTRAVNLLDASRFCQENEVQFMEVSALSGENVEEVFMKLAKTVLGKVKAGAESLYGVQQGPGAFPPKQGNVCSC